MPDVTVVEPRLDEIAQAINGRLKRQWEDVLAIGKLALEAKRLIPYGQFERWVDEKLQLSTRLIRGYVRVYERFESSEIISELPITAGLLLASPSVPDGALQEIEQRLESGERFSVAGVESILDKYRVLEGVQARLPVAEGERNLQPFSPIGENQTPALPPMLPVRGTGLGDLPPLGQAEAYQKAQEIAAAEGDEQISVQHMQQAVAQIKTKQTVFQSRYYVVSHAVATGEITAEAGRQMVEALDKLIPNLRGDVVQLMGKFSLTCPELIAPLAEMFSRQGTEKESKVLPEILTGFLGGTPLNKANMTDLAQARREAALEHAAEAVEAKRQAAAKTGESLIEPVTLVVFPGDREKSLASLQRDLGEARLSWLRETLMSL